MSFLYRLKLWLKLNLKYFFGSENVLMSTIKFSYLHLIPVKALVYYIYDTTALLLEFLYFPMDTITLYSQLSGTIFK